MITVKVFRSSAQLYFQFNCESPPDVAILSHTVAHETFLQNWTLNNANLDLGSARGNDQSHRSKRISQRTPLAVPQTR